MKGWGRYGCYEGEVSRLETEREEVKVLKEKVVQPLIYLLTLRDFYKEVYTVQVSVTGLSVDFYCCDKIF